MINTQYVFPKVNQYPRMQVNPIQYAPVRNTNSYPVQYYYNYPVNQNVNSPILPIDVPIIDRFPYTKEEKEFLEKHPYSTIQDYLLDKKDYKRAIFYEAFHNSDKNYSGVIKYADNPSFDNLLQSKYFKGFFGFEKLLNIVAEMDKKQQDAYNLVHSPGYFCPYLPDVNSLYAGINVDECIKNLDNFFKTDKISEDLKIFILDGTKNLSDIWFVSNNLRNIDDNFNAKSLTVPYLIY